MLSLLGDLLTIGVGVAISPLAIVAVILMATSGKGRTNGSAFVLGCYVFPVVFIGLLVALGRAAQAEDPDSGPRVVIDVLEIILGIALLTLAFFQWRSRSAHGEPKWMGSLDRLTIPKAFLFGLLISGPLSPKDIPLLIAAAGRISEADIPLWETIVVILIFSLIGIMFVMMPWIVSIIAPGQVEKRLTGPRNWLVANHAVIMTVLFLILGAKLLGAGISELASAGGM